MLNRLGLVIHWLGFVCAVWLVCVAIYEITISGVASFSPYDWQEFIGWFIGLSAIGWLINFILSGHKNPLPWVANKEPT